MPRNCSRQVTAVPTTGTIIKSSPSQKPSKKPRTDAGIFEEMVVVINSITIVISNYSLLHVKEKQALVYCCVLFYGLSEWNIEEQQNRIKKGYFVPITTKVKRR